MFSPCHHMSPRRCVYCGSAIALSGRTARAFSRYSGVNFTPTKGDVDHISVYHVTIETSAGDQQTCDQPPAYVNHPIYGFIPSGTPYLALLAARVAS
jgi:hypothetical protein